MTDADRQPPLGDWLRGAAAVAELSFDVDAEAPILAEGNHYAEDLSAMSHQAYGPRVGVPRILDLLAEHAIEATFFVPGVTATLPHAGLSSTSLRPPHPLPSTGKLTCGDLRAAIYCPPLDSTVMIRPRSKAR